ncbi:hypothetical protein CCR75_007693 [Bremia lactucae]|uniref:Uncharacterized protein n=1 Tax=Bremia lactucae TaxID=4779 RepID=A0A976FKD9_BRELC|nr:hypothetical protein CCR75_007693 [Bremia lactucae]
MEYGRLVVLGYSSYRVDMVQRARSDGLDPAPSFGLAHARDETKFSRKRSLGQLWKPLGDQNAHFVLEKRPQANGVRLHRFHHIMPHELAKRVKKKKDLKSITTGMMQRIEATVCKNDQSEDRNALLRRVPYQLCLPMNDQDAWASVTEFHADPRVDMFQIGRMPCRENDFVIPGPRVGSSGTISRYAARILCARDPPYECRIYAGGFDANQQMSTAGHALKYCVRCGTWSKRLRLDHTCVFKTLLQPNLPSKSCQKGKNTVKHYFEKSENDESLEHVEVEVHNVHELPMDGLTKNGVRVWLPERKQWFEVSVNGRLYVIEARALEARETVESDRLRHLHVAMQSRSGTFNRPITGAEDDLPPILTNGAVIDLGGVQLQFQTTFRSKIEANDEHQMLLEAPLVYGRATMSSVCTQLERLNVQCPVQLHSLRFTRTSSDKMVPLDQIPHVFTACGHVFGYEKRIAQSHTCPLCRTPGSLVQLLLKENSQLQSTEEQHAIPECVFNPCGHAISTKLARRYAALLMPNGRAICPFCAVHLDFRVPFSRLYLYCDSD